MAIRLRFTTPAGHGQTNIDCGSVHGGRSLPVLKGKTVSIVGYDGQARAQAPQTCS